MKRLVEFFIALSLLLCGCSEMKPLNSPVHNKVEIDIASDGRAFTVGFLEENFPDQEITITISVNGQRIAEDGSFDAYLNDYDYQNDFVDRWYQIIGEYHGDAVDAYRFYWGMLYTINKGNAYEIIPKHTYETRSENDEVFKNLLAQVE